MTDGTKFERGSHRQFSHPAKPGVVTIAGDSKEEVASLIKEAIEFHIEGLREEGLPVPEPHADAERIRVAA